MFCKNCGKEIDENAYVCVNCGAKVERDEQSVKHSDSGSAGWGVLGFFFPLIGLILYLVWKDNKPKNAKSAGKGALIGVIVEVVLVVIYIVLAVVLTGSVIRSATSMM